MRSLIKQLKPPRPPQWIHRSRRSSTEAASTAHASRYAKWSLSGDKSPAEVAEKAFQRLQTVAHEDVRRRKWYLGKVLRHWSKLSRSGHQPRPGKVEALVQIAAQLEDYALLDSALQLWATCGRAPLSGLISVLSEKLENAALRGELRCGGRLLMRCVDDPVTFMQESDDAFVGMCQTCAPASRPPGRACLEAKGCGGVGEEEGLSVEELAWLHFGLVGIRGTVQGCSRGAARDPRQACTWDERSAAR
eukprot:scaffold146_cov265-Pinguiococcus_pyrenoidosus.AAC.13